MQKSSNLVRSEDECYQALECFGQFLTIRFTFVSAMQSDNHLEDEKLKDDWWTLENHV